MAGKRGAPRGNQNAKGKHRMTGARVGGVAGLLGVRKLTPEAVAFGKSLQKKRQVETLPPSRRRHSTLT